MVVFLKLNKCWCSVAGVSLVHFRCFFCSCISVGVPLFHTLAMFLLLLLCKCSVVSWPVCNVSGAVRFSGISAGPAVTFPSNACSPPASWPASSPSSALQDTRQHRKTHDNTAGHTTSFTPYTHNTVSYTIPLGTRRRPHHIHMTAPSAILQHRTINGNTAMRHDDTVKSLRPYPEVQVRKPEKR